MASIAELRQKTSFNYEHGYRRNRLQSWGMIIKTGLDKAMPLRNLSDNGGSVHRKHFILFHQMIAGLRPNSPGQ